MQAYREDSTEPEVAQPEAVEPAKIKTRASDDQDGSRAEKTSQQYSRTEFY